MFDEKYMRRALELAQKGMGHTNPNPMVGAVIVKEGRIIGEGFHERCGEGHAEVNAFKYCNEDPAGAEMYVTLEPCSHYGKTPPCADLIISKKISKVYVGALDPNPLVAGRGVRKLEDAGIEVKSGILAEESRSLNEVFMKYIVNKDPFVVLKAAMSLDGKIATSSGESKWISCEESRMHAHSLRGRYMAIMAGIGTVLADDPELTCRMEGGKNPIRLIVDSSLRIPEDAKVLKGQDKAKTIIATASPKDTEKRRRIEDRGIRIIDMPMQPERAGTPDEIKVDIKRFIKTLGEEGIDSILIEGGGTLAGTIVREGLVDKVFFYIAPMLIGGKAAKTPVEGAGIENLADSVRLDNVIVHRFGRDIAVEATAAKNVDK